MVSLPTFLVRILKGAYPEEGRRRMVIVVRRPYAYLTDELSRAFGGDGDVHVIVDRRSGDRRRRRQPVAVQNR